jgi:hypothetical protein
MDIPWKGGEFRIKDIKKNPKASFSQNPTNYNLPHIFIITH